MEHECIDCGTDISHKRSDAKRCDKCYEKYRQKYHAKYRKTEKRRETVKRDNDSEAAKLRKRKYNHSLKGKLSHLKYRRTEKGKTSGRAQVLKRRTKISGVGGNLSAAEIRRVKSEYKTCAFCDEKNKLEIEHLIPISRGGTNDYRNLVMACRKCNMQKFNLTADEFFMKYPTKQEYFLKLDANKKKSVGIIYDGIDEDRLKRKPEIWTEDRYEKLIKMWPNASEQDFAQEFPNSSFVALKNVIAKLRKSGRFIPERINSGRFVKQVSV